VSRVFFSTTAERCREEEEERDKRKKKKEKIKWTRRHIEKGSSGERERGRRAVRLTNRPTD